MVDSLFNAMATAAFFEFVIFAVFEMRYMLNIWKSRQGNLLDSRAQQRELLGLYARFYFALLCSIFISYQAQRYTINACFLQQAELPGAFPRQFESALAISI